MKGDKRKMSPEIKIKELIWVGKYVVGIDACRHEVRSVHCSASMFL